MMDIHELMDLFTNHKCNVLCNDASSANEFLVYCEEYGILWASGCKATELMPWKRCNTIFHAPGSPRSTNHGMTWEQHNEYNLRIPLISFDDINIDDDLSEDSDNNFVDGLMSILHD